MRWYLGLSPRMLGAPPGIFCQVAVLERQLPWDSLEVLASAPSVLKINEAARRNSPTSRRSETQQHGKLRLRKRKKWIEFYIKYNIFYWGPFKGGNT